MSKLLRITTVPQSLRSLLKGQHRFMSENGFEVLGVSSPGVALQEVEENEGIRTQAIEMTRTISPLKDLKALWQFYKLCKKEKPAIVHSHTPKAGIIGMLGAKLAGVPVRLHTVAGLPLMEVSGVKRTVLDFVERLTYRCATKIYPNSRGLYDFIVKRNYTTADKLKVIGNGSSNGIDTAWFDPSTVSDETCLSLRTELEISRDDFVFLFVGRIVADKGVNELVEAFRKMNGKHPDSHLVLVGNFERNLDPLKQSTEKSIKGHSHIHAVGYKANVKDYFAFADALVFPSYREGFPNVVMQAAAMQLNAIVSDINGCNEIITDGENGWIVPAKEVKRLRERMEWCLGHRAESREMGMKSRKIMQSDFERSFVWSEILREYNLLLVKQQIHSHRAAL